jgi:nitrogenase-stabilizing/protective protein
MSSFSRDLAKLSSAEDFFAYFDIAYKPRVMAASRLHILKRFHDGLGEIADLESLDDAARKAVYREQLQRAYADFSGATAIQRQIFPGLLRASGNFVALASVKRREG